MGEPASLCPFDHERCVAPDCSCSCHAGDDPRAGHVHPEQMAGGETPAEPELHDVAAAHSKWLRWNGYTAPADCMDRLAELLVLATGRLGQPETVDGRDHGPGIDAQTVIAAYLANQGLVAVGEGWEQHCEDMAIDILSELRAAGLVCAGPRPEVTRQQIATTLASSAMACSSAGMRGVKAYEVQWLTEAVWALLPDGATPAGPVSLAELRKAIGRTQTDVAEVLATTQSGVSRIERQADLHLSTLDAYVAATGGRLRVLAEYPGSSYEIGVGATPAGPEATDGQ